MFKSILVPIDVADTIWPSLRSRPSSVSQTWNGSVPPAQCAADDAGNVAEYVPADFDVLQRAASEEALAEWVRNSAVESSRISRAVRRGRSVSRGILEEAAGEGEPDRDDLTPAGDADLFPRLQRQPCHTAAPGCCVVVQHWAAGSPGPNSRSWPSSPDLSRSPSMRHRVR